MSWVPFLFGSSKVVLSLVESIKVLLHIGITAWMEPARIIATLYTSSYIITISDGVSSTLISEKNIEIQYILKVKSCGKIQYSKLCIQQLSMSIEKGCVIIYTWNLFIHKKISSSGMELIKASPVTLFEILLGGNGVWNIFLDRWWFQRISVFSQYKTWKYNTALQY